MGKRDKFSGDSVNVSWDMGLLACDYTWHGMV